MNLLSWVRSLGAGWFVEWRDAVENKAKAAFQAILNSIEEDAQPVAIAGFDAAKTAVLAKLASGGSVQDAEGAAIDALKATLAANGKTLAEDAFTHIVAAVMASATASQTTATA